MRVRNWILLIVLLTIIIAVSSESSDSTTISNGTIHSEKVSGTGSIKKDYYVFNKANDSAKVSVDIKNSTYYEYKYRIYSDEIQCIADLDLVVGHAESIKCSGYAKNRSNIPTDINTVIKNGNLTYNNSVVASIHGVQASQNITNASGDNINGVGTATGDNNLKLVNIIAANSSEGFKGTQMVSIGVNTSTLARIDAVTGPMKVSSYISKGDRKLNTTADVAAGVVSIKQLINPFEALQNSKGVIGGVNFDTVIENANGDKTDVHTSAGSGNLANLSQRASGKDTDYTMEYEYMPVSYSTGVYDVGYFEGGSDILSNKSLASKVISQNCEHMKIIHTANLNDDPLINTSLNAITGPLKFESYIGAGDHRLNTTANVAAGLVSVDQLINLTEAHQISKGVIGGAKFETTTTNPDGKKKDAYTTIGSGNLINLSQLASWTDARYHVEYGYMPVSYQTGTYDTNLNSSKVERN